MWICGWFSHLNAHSVLVLSAYDYPIPYQFHIYIWLLYGSWWLIVIRLMVDLSLWILMEFVSWDDWWLFPIHGKIIQMFQTINQIQYTILMISFPIWVCGFARHVWWHFVGSERSRSSCTKAAEQAQGCLVLGPESAPFGAFARNQNGHPKWIDPVPVMQYFWGIVITMISYSYNGRERPPNLGISGWILNITSYYSFFLNKGGYNKIKWEYNKL